MRLITWNCQGAFRKKLQYVRKLRPDILVIQECEKVVGEQGDLFEEAPSSSHVLPPDTIHKGLGIFTFGNYKAEVAPFYNPEHTVILPMLVSGPVELLVVGVWTLPMNRTYRLVYIIIRLHMAL